MPWSANVPFRRAATLAVATGATVAAAGPVRADTLLTVEGTTLVGTVQPTPGGFIVQSKDGSIEVAAADVRQVLYDRRPAAAPSPPTRELPAHHTAAGWIALGRAALQNGKFADARRAFTAAEPAAPEENAALRGLGYADLRLNQPTAAVDPLEHVIAHRAGVPDRSLSLGLSAAWLADDKPMRAVRLLTAYLTAHEADRPVDEPMLNALGTAMAHVTVGAMQSPPYLAAQAVYDPLDAALAADRPGQKRWGVTWETASTVDAKTSALHDAQQREADAAVLSKAKQVLAATPVPLFPRAIATDGPDVSVSSVAATQP